MDERYYPVYDVLGRFSSREEALIALAEYHKNPYSISDREITFSELYKKFYKNKYEYSEKTFSQSSVYCTKSAYQHCSTLYDRIYAKLHPDDFRSVLGQINEKGKPLSHALQEHIKNLFSQMDKFALQNDIIAKGYASYASITVSEDDTPGVPFTAEELQILWDNKDVPWVDSILIYIYSGWRVSELILMPSEDINLTEMTFKGGLKTSAGKNRIVPIHSRIQGFVTHRLTVNQVCIDRLIGHASKSLTTRTYTHKSIEELRQAVEMI